MDIRPLRTAAQSAPVKTEKTGTPEPIKPEPEAANNELEQAEMGAAGGPQPPVQQIKQALQDVNQTMRSLSLGLEFSVDENDRTIVKVVDQETKEVIRQVPSKEIIEIAKALERSQGLLIKQRV